MRAGLDPAPLLAHLAVRSLYELDKAGSHANDFGVPEVRGMAAVAGVHESTVHRWRRGGRVRRVHADRCAAALDLHPLLIWPDYYA